VAKIRVEQQYHEFYRVLAGSEDEPGKRKTFDTMKDVFMLAFGFGVSVGRRTPLATSREIFDDNVLKDGDWNLIRAARLAEDEKALVEISNEDGLVSSAQEYANTGIRILQQKFLPAQPEESIATALLEQLSAQT
jgi:dnd system-associated protein 4